jgi:hypothetical protein
MHGDPPHMWTVELDNAQRNDLASWIGEYQPTFWEELGSDPTLLSAAAASSKEHL